MSGFLSGLIPLEKDSGGFEAPGVQSFDVPPLFEGVPWLEWLDKYMLQSIISVILILIFWMIMARKNAMVPSKGQYLGETAYFFVRNTIARDMFGVFPLSLLPTPSHIGWPYGLALLVWVIYNGVGIAKHGFFGYLKHATLPSGVPAFMWPLIIPLEFVSNILVRPVTLSLRLFANMFAGHLLVLVFVLGGEYLLLHSESIINKTAGVVALIFSMAIFGLEIFVQSLQAFIFTVLTAQYISSAAAEEH